MHEPDTTWDDMDPDQLETVPLTDLHRLTGPLVIAADKGAFFLSAPTSPPNVEFMWF